jgi:hypothetical protein
MPYIYYKEIDLKLPNFGVDKTQMKDKNQVCPGTAWAAIL